MAIVNTVEVNPEVEFRLGVAQLEKQYGVNISVGYSQNQGQFLVRIQQGLNWIEYPFTKELIEHDPLIAVQSVDTFIRGDVIKQVAEEKAEVTMEEIKVKKRIRMGKWGVPSAQMPWKN